MQEKKKQQKVLTSIQKRFKQCFCVIDLYRYMFKVSLQHKKKKHQSFYNLLAFLNFQKSRVIINKKQDDFIQYLRNKIEYSFDWKNQITISQLESLELLIKQRKIAFQNLLKIMDTYNCFGLHLSNKMKNLYCILVRFLQKLSREQQKREKYLPSKERLNIDQKQLKQLKIEPNQQKEKQIQKTVSEVNNKNKKQIQNNQQNLFQQKINKLKKQYKAYKTLNDEHYNSFENQQKKQLKKKYILKSKILKTEFDDIAQTKHENDNNDFTKIQIKMNKSKLSSTFCESNSLFSNNSFHQSFIKHKNSIKNNFKDNQKRKEEIQQEENQIKNQQKKSDKIFNFLRKGISKSINLTNSNSNSNSINDKKYSKFKGNSFIQLSQNNKLNVKKIVVEKQTKLCQNQGKYVQHVQQLKRKQSSEMNKTIYFHQTSVNNSLSNALNEENQQKLKIQNKKDQKSLDFIQQQVEKQYKYISKNKNRRKGFSKKHIESQDQQSLKNVYSKKRNLNLNQIQKNQRNYNRTSFFRTSGYLQKQQNNLINQKSQFSKKSHFRKKKECIQSEKFSFQEEPAVQKNKDSKIKSQVKNEKNRKKTIDQSISFKDVCKLSKEILDQDKFDKQNKYANYVNDLMKSKYAPCENQKIGNESQQNMSSNLKKRLKIMESEMEHRSNFNFTNWHKQNVDQIEFSKRIINKSNLLGQKDMSKDNKIKNLFNFDLQVYLF